MQSVSAVVTLTPSRGLMHSRTVAAVLAALDTATAHGAITARGWLLSHDLPIPDSHESLAEQGMATGADFLWFVEEDVLPPSDALVLLLTRQRETGAGVVLMDYPVGEHPTRSAILRQPDDGRSTILYGGIGCALIAREALERIPQPWFDTSHEYALSQANDGRYILTRNTNRAYDYGGLDVAFCCHATQYGVSLAAVNGAMAGHARVRAFGAPHTNDGAHSIDVLTEIEAR